MSLGRVIEDRSGALDLLLECIHSKSFEEIAPIQAVGRVVADDVRAVVAVPEVAVSLRDGFAMLASDTLGASNMPVSLLVMAHLPAEAQFPSALSSGQAVRVLTGGPVPPGADCVVADEDVHWVDSQVVVSRPVAAAEHVRAVGEDLAQDKLIIAPGERLTPQAASVLIRAGVAAVRVHPTPVASVFALGNELFDPFGPAVPGRMPADNMLLASGLLKQAGLGIRCCSVLPDNVEDVAAALGQEPLPDLIITTGGTGHSERDFARLGAERAGFSALFGAVNIRPGKGMFAAVRKQTLLLGLPGPPGAVFACLHAFLPLIVARLRGLSSCLPLWVRLKGSLSSRPGGEWLVPCELKTHSSGLEAHPLVGVGLSPLAVQARAQGVLAVPESSSPSSGQMVEFLSIHP